ncbi:MAG TPA: LCI fold-containing protein [Terriglobales bacterium]|nr:LCI fold-containing protein [Terriglobales bacterium]
MATPVQQPTMSGEEVGSKKMPGVLGRVVKTASVIVLAICLYAFLIGNGVFAGRFDNDGVAWYFLAKGIFCSTALYLLLKVVEALPRAR